MLILGSIKLLKNLAQKDIFSKITFCNTCIKIRVQKSITSIFQISSSGISLKQINREKILVTETIPVPEPLYPSLEATAIFFGGLGE